MAAKRILILTNRVPFPLNDGGNLAMHAMVEGYTHAGWEVFLLSMNTSRHYIQQQELDTIYKDIYAFETVDINNDVKPLPTLLNYFFSSQPNHTVRFSQKVFADKLATVLSGFKPDVVQVESIYLSGYLALIKEHSQAQTVLRMHNIEYQVWQRLADETDSFFKKIYLGNLARRIKKYEEHAWTNYDLLLPITDIDAAVTKNIVPEAAMLTIPFGIETGHVVYTDTAKWDAYHIGAMDWLPNAEGINWFLQDVWPEMHRQVPGMHFYFAGRNMPDSFKQIEIEGAFCMGEVPDAAAFIADKKILVVPLRSGGGIRVKILEGMAAGKLVISTTVGMQGIDAVPGEHYILANTPEDFLIAIKWVSDHNAEAEQMARNARELVINRYDEAVIMKKLTARLAET